MARYQWPQEAEITGEVDVKNLDTKTILIEILKEMKKQSLLLSLIANEEINDNDY